MNFSVSNQTPSFKGIYVVEGTGKEVKEFKEMIMEHWRFSEQVPQNMNIEDRINKLNYHYITGRYGDDQKCAKLLITTNEDTSALTAWRDKYIIPQMERELGPRKPAGFIDSHMGFRPKPLSKEEIKAQMEECKSAIASLSSKMAEFEYAHSGNDDALLDFIAKTNEEAATKLEQIKEFTTKKIKTFKFKDVMEALNEGRFNIATGKMKAKIKI